LPSSCYSRLVTASSATGLPDLWAEMLWPKMVQVNVGARVDRRVVSVVEKISVIHLSHNGALDR
jgi:hypothetical protein